MDELATWHQIVFNKDLKLLHSTLAEDVLFRTPLYLKPRIGRDLVTAVLASALNIFQDFKYHREFLEKDSMCLEFEATVEGKQIKGVDIIRWKEGRIVEFEVMMRPINSLKRFGELQASGIPDMIAKLGLKAKL
jgi:hypothetical protein